MTVDKLIYRNQIFDSLGEVQFAKWLDELKAAGYVEKWKKCKDEDSILLTNGLKLPYTKITKLKTKIKEETKYLTLLRPSVYTPDFEVWFTPKGYNNFVQDITEPLALKGMFYYNSYIENSVLFEVKPSFDENNMERLFVNNQKFLWQTKAIFVNLVEPVELFKKTFMPEAVRSDFILKKTVSKGKNKGKKPGEWKIDFEPKTFNQFITNL